MNLFLRPVRKPSIGFQGLLYLSQLLNFFRVQCREKFVGGLLYGSEFKVGVHQ